MEIKRNKYSESDLDNSETRVFRENHILSETGFYFYGFLIFILWVIIKSPIDLSDIQSKLFFSSIVIIIGLGISYRFHYFIITNNLIIAKNVIWFWRTHAHSFTDIKEIIFEHTRKFPTKMIVKTKYGESFSYPSDIVEWHKLKDFLFEKKIKLTYKY